MIYCLLPVSLDRDYEEDNINVTAINQNFHFLIIVFHLEFTTSVRWFIIDNLSLSIC